MVKRAIVVGINDYTILDPTGNTNLSCCVRDAQSMYHLLIDAFGFDRDQVFYYADRNASRANILRALRYITNCGEPGDVACFYYSGHGARIRADRGRADADKYYEAIIPSSGDWITDWEISQIANELQPSVMNFTIILDSCHSGGIHETDAVQKNRSLYFSAEMIQALMRFLKTLIPCGICLPTDATVLSNNVHNVSANGRMVDLDEDPDRTLVQQSKSTLIAGCKFDELSWEDRNIGHGLLTQSFLDLVNQNYFQITYHDLLNELRRRVEQKIAFLIRPHHPGVTQTPQLRGQMNRMEELFVDVWRDCR